MYKLIIEDDEGKTTVVPLIRDEITIGRKEGNTIRLTERNISRRHAKILRNNGAVFIEDLGSYNGIKLNGGRVAGKSSVAEGDCIQIGDYQLKLAKQAAEADPFVDQRTTPMLRDEADPSKTQPSLPVHAGPPQPPPSSHPNLSLSPGGRSGTALIAPPAAILSSAGDPTQRIDLGRMAPPQPAGAADQQGKLVTLTTELGGREFVLDKGTMVVGRTDDNDIVLNHRSISRHHAKIVREGGRYSVVDLQSANGVRVNGEEYGKVELRRGDMLDLGHVRLRFVEAGESFAYSGPEEGLAGSRPRAKGVAIVLLAAGLVVGGVVVAVIATRHPTPTVAVASGGNAVPATTTPSASPSPAMDPKLVALLDKAQKARNQLQWDDELKSLSQILRLDPQNSIALDMQGKAQAEKANAVTFARYSRAASVGDFEHAVAFYNQLAEDSVYREKAGSNFDEVKRGYLQEHMTALQTDVSAHDCTAAEREKSAIGIVDPNDAAAADRAAHCTTGGGLVAAQVTAPVHNPAISHPTANPETAPGGTSAVAPAACDAAQLGDEATQALRAKDYDTAARKGNAALRCSGDKSNAWLAIGAAACANGDGKVAANAIKHVDPGRASFIKQACDHDETDLP